MAVTAARTSTKTYPRLTLVCTQVRRILRRTTEISDEALDRITHGVRERWIKEISIHGFDESSMCRASVEFAIDWSEYDRQLSLGRATIVVEERKWPEDTAIEVDECIRAFNDCVTEQGLSPKWRVAYADGVYSDSNLLARVRESLGLKPAEPIKWGGRIVGEPFSIRELPETKVGHYFSE
jgi:hypothetical protein